MNPVRIYLVTLLMACAAACTAAAQSVLAIADHINDSTIVYPQSVETDVNKMMQNWYLRTYTALDKEADQQPDVTTSDEEIIKRLQSIPTTIELPFNSVVRAYIDMYTGKKRSLVETMLGMSLYYMPIFEEALEREGLPIELKYLPVIESALNPDAVSRAGATGLWQIMLSTARGLGLEVNTLVDERRDPVASSAAATAYLRQLYEIYHDWSLAIAAYNCGPGNINKALRRAGADTDSTRHDFWAIYPFLPQETRGYVPCFIAATYVMNHYNKHNISPALAKRPILTDSVHVHHRVNFKQIADVLQLPVEELQILNPQYRKQEIPGDIRPYSLVLPANQVYSYILSEKTIASREGARSGRRDKVEPSTGFGPRTAVVNGQAGEWVTVEDVKYHKVARNETMASIAKKYGVSLSDLKRANKNISRPKRGQTLKIVTSKDEFRPYEDTPQPEENDNLLVRNDIASDTEETTAARQVELTDSATTAEIAEVTADYTTLPTDSSTVATDAPAETSGTSAAPSDSVNSKVASTFSNSRSNKTAETPAQTSKSQKSKQSTAKSSQRTHTVRRGESLYKIAKKYGTTVEELQRLNGKNTKLQIGDKIKLP
ncbi:MAG: transglycosylase SLT domain-containing protein [Bacteroidales bacterium]|nr:transglycosylase SLT domain-containing protein [Bacteroidales bacterium]